MNSLSELDSELMLSFVSIINKIIMGKHLNQIDKLNIRRDQIDALRRMNYQQLQQLSLNTSRNIFSLNINQKALDEAIKVSAKRVEEEEIIHNLIKGGASRELMRHYFGINPKYFSQLRKFLGLSIFNHSSEGRTPQLNEEDKLILWRKYELFKDHKKAYPQLLILLHEETSYNITAIDAELKLYTQKLKLKN